MADAKIRLLLVEDDVIDQQAFKRFVAREQLPYEVTPAASLRDAERALTAGSFDVVVSDYILGDGTAFDVFRVAAGTPFILVTGAGDEHVAVAALRLGIADYLVKDVRRGDLQRLPLSVARAVRMAETERRLALLSHALTNIPDAVLITNREGRVVFANEEFRRLYGDEHALVGEPPEVPWCERDTGPPSSDAWTHEVWHCHEDGRSVAISLVRRPMLDAAGAVTAVVYVCHRSAAPDSETR